MATRSELELDEVRAVWGRCRYDPDDIEDVERLVSTLSGRSDRRMRSLLADAVAELAANDPDRLTDHVRDLAGNLSDEDLGPPAGRALAHLVRVDGKARRTLQTVLESEVGRDLEAAVGGLRSVADDYPRVAADTAESLVAAGADAAGPESVDPDLPGDPSRRSAIVDPETVLEDATAALVPAFAADSGVESTVLDSLSHDDPGRRAVGARVVGGAAGRGEDAATDALSDVVELVDDDEVVRLAALAALSDAAGAGADPLAAEVDRLLSIRADEEVERAATRALADLARADAVVFDSLVELIDGGPRPLSGVIGKWVGWPDHDRALSAVAHSAGAHPERFGRHESVLEELVDVDVVAAGRAVRDAAARDPEPLEHAVSPVCAAIENHPPEQIRPVHQAAGELASAYPEVPKLVLKWLDEGDRKLTWRASVACRHLAERSPEALYDAEIHEGGTWSTGAAELLREDLADSPAPAFRALARLGRRHPHTVLPVADTVATIVRRNSTDTRRSEWMEALYELAGVVAHVDADAVESVALVVADDLTPREAEAAVPFLSAHCAERPRFADRLVDQLDDRRVRQPVLQAIATATQSSPDTVARHAPRLRQETERRHWAVRNDATKALATVVAESDDRWTGKRLTDLVYDPEPSVRQWAAFGLGELLADGWSDGTATGRLELVADHDGEAAPEARLALVRAGVRSASAVADDLVRIAVEADRAPARTAVTALANAPTDRRENLLRVHEHVDDPRIRDRVETELGGDPRP